MNIDNIIPSTLKVVASSGLNISSDNECIEKSIASLIEISHETKTTSERK
jgi:hypothetical protein